MPFSDPIIGGSGELIRDEIRSSDYAPGMAGWRLGKDGTAEILNLLARGSGVFGDPAGERIELTDAGELRAYNAANQLIVEVTAAGLGMSDPASGSAAQLLLSAGVTSWQLSPPALAGHVLTGAQLLADSDAGAGDAWARLRSPRIDGAASSRVDLYGQNGALPDEVGLFGTRISFNGRAQGEGPVARAFGTTNAAAVAAETAQLTSTIADFKDGRAYRVEWGPSVVASIANSRVIVRIRKNTVAGAVLHTTAYDGSATAGQLVAAQGCAYIKNTTGATITCALAWTIAPTGGATAFQVATRWLLVEDIGVATDFDWATDLT